jgi:hypothetical protein
VNKAACPASASLRARSGLLPGVCGARQPDHFRASGGNGRITCYITNPSSLDTFPFANPGSSESRPKTWIQSMCERESAPQTKLIIGFSIRCPHKRNSLTRASPREAVVRKFAQQLSRPSNTNAAVNHLMAFPYRPNESAPILNRAGAQFPKLIFAVPPFKHDRRSGL